MTRSIFVYGTLLPGASNWHVIEPFAVDEGTADAARGCLFDTGLGWPAAVFGRGDGRVLGRVLELREERLATALAVLDEFEGTHAGEYARIEITTEGGRTAWAYHSYEPGDATPIGSGDWLEHVGGR